MSDIFITIRNQNDNAMTSVDGMAFVAILKQDGSIVDRKLVGLRFADAQFPNVPPGRYTAIAFHESVNPPSASQEVTLTEFGIVRSEVSIPRTRKTTPPEL